MLTYLGNLSNGIQLQTRLLKDVLKIDAAGSHRSLAELGEQLAWLGAACRRSSGEEITYSTTRLESEPRFKTFTISFEEKRISIDRSAKPKGICWLKLFRNPVIAYGYPILARDEENVGLEIPLDMMASLVEASYATDFDGGYVIKGFSGLIFPTKRSNDLVLWHLVYKEDGSHISFLDANENNRCSSVAGPENVDVSCLGDSRHFLGWTSSSILKAGIHHYLFIISMVNLRCCRNERDKLRRNCLFRFEFCHRRLCSKAGKYHC